MSTERAAWPALLVALAACGGLTRAPSDRGVLDATSSPDAQDGSAAPDVGSPETQDGSMAFDAEPDSVICTQGTTRCLGQQVQTCESGGAWGAAASCEASETCCSTACTTLSSDPKNCGRCGHDCQGGGCADGVCQPMTLLEPIVGGGIAVNATTVYLATGGYVLGVPVSGGSPTTLYSGPSSGALAPITVDATSVYFSDVSPAGAVMKEPLGGGTVTTLASNQSYPEELAVRGTDIYWTTTVVNVANGFAIVRGNVGGGSVVTLVANRTVGGNTYNGGIAFDASHLYCASASTGVIFLPIGGGSVGTLSTDPNGAIGVATDGVSGYWTDYTGVKKIALGGGLVATLASGQVVASNIVLDAANAYWIDNGAVMMVSLGGGTPTTLASGQSSPVGIAVDATSIYWANSTQYYLGTQGALMKLAKP